MWYDNHSRGATSINIAALMGILKKERNEPPVGAPGRASSVWVE